MRRIGRATAEPDRGGSRRARGRPAPPPASRGTPRPRTAPTNRRAPTPGSAARPRRRRARWRARPRAAVRIRTRTSPHGPRYRICDSTMLSIAPVRILAEVGRRRRARRRPVARPRVGLHQPRPDVLAQAVRNAERQREVERRRGLGRTVQGVELESAEGERGQRRLRISRELAQDSFEGRDRLGGVPGQARDVRQDQQIGHPETLRLSQESPRAEGGEGLAMMSAARQLAPGAGVLGDRLPSRRCDDRRVVDAAGASGAPTGALVGLRGRGRVQHLQGLARGEPAGAVRNPFPAHQHGAVLNRNRQSSRRARAIEPGPHHLHRRQPAFDLPAPRAARTDLEVRAPALEHRHERGPGRLERREPRACRRARRATRRTSTAPRRPPAPPRRRAGGRPRSGAGRDRAARRSRRRSPPRPRRRPRPSPRPARDRGRCGARASIPRQTRARASSLVGSARRSFSG